MYKETFSKNLIFLYLQQNFLILTFTKNLSNLTIQVQVDNSVRWYPQSTAWVGIDSYLLSHQITITAEYLSNNRNAIVDWETKGCNKLVHVETSPGSNFENNQILSIPSSRSVWLQGCSSTSWLGLKQSSLRKCRNADIINIYVVDTTLVYSPVRNVWDFRCFC